MSCICSPGVPNLKAPESLPFPGSEDMEARLWMTLQLLLKGGLVSQSAVAQSLRPDMSEVLAHGD